MRVAQKIALGLAIVVGVWPLSLAQGPECQKRTVTVNVRDRLRKFVSDLSPNSFRAKIEGQQIKVLSVRADVGPRRVVLLLDASGSVQARLGTARLAAGNFLLKAPAGTRVALVTFSGHIIDAGDFGQSPTEIVEKLAELKNGQGRTALFDSLVYAAKRFGSGMAGDSVFLISDGGENSSHAHSSDVKREFIASGVRIFALRLSVRDFPTEEERSGLPLLMDLAQSTGGSVVDAGLISSDRDVKALSNALQHFYDEISRFYRLDIELPIPVEKEHSWKLQVIDDNGKERRDLDVSYARDLPPCSIEHEGK